MPNQDKTGPRGQGPKTGLGLGPCNDNSFNVPQDRPLGRGRGVRGRGAGADKIRGTGQATGLGRGRRSA